VGGRRLVQVLVAARMRRRRHRLRSAKPGGGQVACPEAVPSVGAGKERRRGDVILDGGDVRRPGRGGRRRVVMTQRVRVVLERDAHRLPVLHRRRAGHIARGRRNTARHLVRLAVERRQRTLPTFTVHTDIPPRDIRSVTY